MRSEIRCTPTRLALAAAMLAGLAVGARADGVTASNVKAGEGVAVAQPLRPAADETPARVVSARGVQIYECRAAEDHAARHAWVFVAPEADLFDADGRKIGRHYAGPHWEAADGSTIVGTVKARMDAPAPGAIAWLLLSARPVVSAGSFGKVTSVQRINTAGGLAPETGCSEATAGATARVAYTADYVFFVPEATRHAGPR